MTDLTNNATCTVETSAFLNGRLENFRGVGVFLGPKTVLTNWHCVQGGKTVIFEAADGQRANIKRGGAHYKDADLDLALVELDRPIAPDIALLPGRTLSEIGQCWLKTRFNNQSGVHPATLEQISLFEFKERGGIHFNPQTDMPFVSTTKVQPGYSGSPIFAKDGMTLISVTKSYVPERTAKATETFSRDFFASGCNAKVVKPEYPFLGVATLPLMRWLRSIPGQHFNWA